MHAGQQEGARSDHACLQEFLASVNGCVAANFDSHVPLRHWAEIRCGWELAQCTSTERYCDSWGKVYAHAVYAVLKEVSGRGMHVIWGRTGD